MNQENLNTGQPFSENKQKITLGQKLKTVRDALNITTTDVSDQLHIPINIIEDIESDKIENLTVFILGYIRNYARLLKIPTYEINPLLTDLGWKPTEEMLIQKTVGTSQISAKDKRVRLVTYAIIILLIILVLIWHCSHRSVDSTISGGEPITTISDQAQQSPPTQENDTTTPNPPTTWQPFMNEDI